MTTAVDSSVLLDVFGADVRFGERSREALRSAYDAGALLACDVVWAEVRAHFPNDRAFQEALEVLGVRYDPLSSDAARLAGQIWRRARRPRGARRRRVVPDFLVGAHAQIGADRLLTRDRGFYRMYFSRLPVVDPSAS